MHDPGVRSIKLIIQLESMLNTLKVRQAASNDFKRGIAMLT